MTQLALDPERSGILICGHGSRDEQAVSEFQSLAQGLTERLPNIAIESGFLEFATPVLRDRLDALRRCGKRHILAVPAMLFAAGHAKNDIPSLLYSYAAEHPGLEIEYARELGVDTAMVRAAAARIEAACAKADAEQGEVSRHETLLVVDGRGASDPDANANVAKVTRLLWEGLGFGWGQTAYSGVTFPLVTPCLERVRHLGFKRILVFPYFLFTGVLVKRIYEHSDGVAEQTPGIQFVKAGYLSDHPLVIDTFVRRLAEILEGNNAMNCMGCKYREQVLGFEDEVGLPQESHHHHVEGIGTDSEQSAVHSQQGHHHGHGHGHGQTHDHSHHHVHQHHPYPHADHPLGPHSLPGKRENGKIICPCGRWAVAEAETKIETETKTATGGTA